MKDSARAEYWFEKSSHYNYALAPLQHGADNLSIARFYRMTGRAEKGLKLLLSLEDPHLYYLLAKGDALLSGGRKREARACFDSITVRAKPVFRQNDSNPNWLVGPDFLYQSIAFHRLGRKKDFAATIARAMEAPDGWRYFWLACVFAQTGQPEKAISFLEKAEKAGWEPNPAQWITGTVKDELLDPLRGLPEFQAWEKRWSPPYKDYSKD